MLESITGGYKTQAKLKGACLTLSFPDAETPGVWSIDLAKAGEAASIFELKEDTAGKSFTLTYREGNKTPKSVATYKTRPQAVRALVLTSRALNKRSITTAEDSSSQTQKGSGATTLMLREKAGFPWGKILLLLIVAAIGYQMFTARNSGPTATAQIAPAPATQNTVAAPATTATRQNTDALPAGEAVSADELLEQMMRQ